MKLKAKLLSTIAAACMVICLLAVGVWAVSAGTINITGSVSFTTDDVYVSILGQVTGTETAVDDYSAEWNVATADTDLEDWDLEEMVFARSGETLSPIEITITVTNLSTEREATVTFADVTEELAADAGITVEMSEKVVVLETNDGAEGGADTAVFTITITPKDADANKSVKGDDFAATLTIENGDTTTDPGAGV